MKRWQHDLDFNKVIDLQFKYGYHVQYKASTFNNDLNGEVIDKLWQLSLLIRKVINLEKRLKFIDFLYLWVRVTKTNLPNPVAALFHEWEKEIQTYTESFYYIAWRLVYVFNHLPNLKKIQINNDFGVNLVRNHLLEHPQNTSQIFIRSFGYLGANGPQIKAGRYTSQQDNYIDPGLYKNAEQLIAKMNVSLNQYMSDTKIA